MKRRLMSILMVMVLLISSMGVMNVNAATSGVYEYEMYTDDTVMITKYTGNENQKLVIPSEIDGYKVVAIYNQAFENLQAEEIILPDTLEYIGTLAFLNTYAKKIHIPKSVISLGAASFCGADFTTFTVDKESETLKAIDGVLYSKDGAVLVSYPCGKSETKFTVPEGVEYIYNGAFFCSHNLEKVIMPEGLLGIYPEAFIACMGISSVDIPATVEYVGEYAFSQCTSLKEINVLGGDIDYISSTAFEDTYWYEHHPEGVMYLGTMAYSYNRTAIVGEVADIREGTTMICEKAFATDCPYHLYIPASVEFIDFSAFFEPTHLEDINVHEDNKYFCSVDGVLYSKDMKILYSYPISNERKTMIIPDGVEVIYESAFRKSTRLEEIICPDSLVAIGDHAFTICYNLKRIEFKGNIQYVGQDILDGCSHVEEIIIPEGCAAFSREDFEDTAWFTGLSSKYLVNLNGCILGYKKVSEAGIVYLPEGAVSVGEMAFANHTKLHEVVFPSTLSKIGLCAFENCPKLTEVTIPASVDEIYPFALGYTYVEGETVYDGEHFPVEGFVIKGYTNSVAEAYAIENGFEFVPIGEIEVSKLLGDADLDGVITIKDATAIQKYLASLELFVSQQKLNADMNGDGEINIKDATAIQKHIAGLAY